MRTKPQQTFSEADKAAWRAAQQQRLADLGEQLTAQVAAVQDSNAFTRYLVTQAVFRDAPKTESSRRLLPLTDTLVVALRKHKVRQDTERHLLGEGWVDRDLVFTTGHGTAIEPHNLFDHFKAALQKAGLPEIRFHDLRHSCASILLAQNVHPRVIMEILGHSYILDTDHVSLLQRGNVAIAARLDGARGNCRCNHDDYGRRATAGTSHDHPSRANPGRYRAWLRAAL